ncbi:C-terminal binding protein [Paenibacillus validus]|uniref:C-terminal binding protein n=1 Tax=Paenibacillus validus TaxID=44253 RepID=A0A7X2Z9V5_9BACL|nr:C-terminal binding protein [Paenibacillus validus]MED4604755.1 C-terminal binding protein [Paenibacillus validus]MUG71023.1 C-terminal binding protein [Paenibacillus validus]
MRKFKVVVTDWEYADLRFEEKVFQAYEEIELVPAQCRTEEDLIRVCQDADALINQYAPITRRVIESLQNCKVITRYGVGVNTVDLDAATEKGICVANVPDYCMDEVSDHALALLLSWARKVTAADHHVKNGVWDFKLTQPIYRLRERTIGLVGFGRIPQALAEKVKPLHLRVIAYDPFFPADVAKQKGVELVSLDALCEQSDFISVHAPLTADTKGLLGEKQFALMKKDAVVINTSRGPVIDEQALIAALEKGQIAGAALDVVEEEPIASDNPLLRMEQVILTPHVAWYSEESAAELRAKAAMGVADVLVFGEYPKYLVNHKVKEQGKLEASQPEARYAKLV